MCKNSISKLIEIIKEDISILIKNIQEKESSFEYFISESKKNRDLLTISFSYFLELFRKKVTIKLPLLFHRENETTS